MSTHPTPGAAGFDPLQASTRIRPRGDRPVPPPEASVPVGLTTELMGPRSMTTAGVDPMTARTALPGTGPAVAPSATRRPGRLGPRGSRSPSGRRALRWVIGPAALSLVFGCVGTALLLRGDDALATTTSVQNATVPADASLAWSALIPPGTSVSDVAQRADGTTIVSYTAQESGDDPAADPRLVAYDDDGEEIWGATYDGLRYTEPALVDDVVLVLDGSTLRALDPADGSERWEYDDVDGLFASTAGALVTVRHGDDIGVAMVDPESGAERFRVDGTLSGPPSAGGFLVEREGNVHRYGLDGLERWRADLDALGLGTDGLLTVEADGVVVLSSRDADSLVGVDPVAGHPLWREPGDFRLLTSAPAGDVAALRPAMGGETEDDQDASLVLFDVRGERTATGPGAIDARGDVTLHHVDGRQYAVGAGVVLDDDLDVVAEHGTPVLGVATGGVYLHDGSDLVVAAWESTDSDIRIEVGATADAIHPLDGAVAVVDETTGELSLYR